MFRGRGLRGRPEFDEGRVPSPAQHLHPGHVAVQTTNVIQWLGRAQSGRQVSEQENFHPGRKIPERKALAAGTDPDATIGFD